MNAAVDAASTVVGAAQPLMHESSCTIVVPGVLLSVASFLMCYRVATEEKHDAPLTGFLGQLVLQMLPMIALKYKMWTLSDRVSLVPKVLVKTLLMHLFVIVLRIIYLILKQSFDFDKFFVYQILLGMAVCWTLKNHFNFSFSPGAFLEHVDVRNILVLACACAFASEFVVLFIEPRFASFSAYEFMQEGMKPRTLVLTASNYLDIVAFMPAVWKLYVVEKEFEDTPQGTMVSYEEQQQSKWFFAIVFAFYAWDDALYPNFVMQNVETMVLVGHAAHLVLLLDFVGFFLFQVKNAGVGAVKTEQMHGLLERGFDDSDY